MYCIISLMIISVKMPTIHETIDIYIYDYDFFDF